MDEFGEKPGSEDEFEQGLRTALRPNPAPNGFADRVITRVQEMPPETKAWVPDVSILRRRFIPRRRRSGFPLLLRWSFAVVLLLAVAVGGFTAHQRERRIAGDRARDQVLLALRITSFTIRAMRDQAETDNHNHRQQQETP